MERGEEGETALHWAALLGRIDMIKLLLGRGAEVKCPVTGPVGTGQQPIHWAASKGHLHVVDFLLKVGAKIAASTALYCCCAVSNHLKS